jgi:hypothetical protein
MVLVLDVLAIPQVYRAPDPEGPNQHEHDAMMRHLIKKLRGIQRT